MPHNILAYPFNITPAGNAAVVPQGGDEEAAQTVEVIISTVIGERPMAFNFGIPDPAFVGLETADIDIVLKDFDLEHIEIEDVRVEWPTEQTQQASVAWKLADPEPDDSIEIGDLDDD